MASEPPAGDSTTFRRGNTTAAIEMARGEEVAV